MDDVELSVVMERALVWEFFFCFFDDLRVGSDVHACRYALFISLFLCRFMSLWMDWKDTNWTRLCHVSMLDEFAITKTKQWGLRLKVMLILGDFVNFVNESPLKSTSRKNELWRQFLSDVSIPHRFFYSVIIRPTKLPFDLWEGSKQKWISRMKKVITNDKKSHTKV